MPIVGALVQVFKDSELIASGYTDSEGKWSYTLEAGTYLIRISKTGYSTIEKTEVVATRTQLFVNLPEAIEKGGYDFTPESMLLYDMIVEDRAWYPQSTLSYETVVT